MDEIEFLLSASYEAEQRGFELARRATAALNGNNLVEAFALAAQAQAAFANARELEERTRLPPADPTQLAA